MLILAARAGDGRGRRAGPRAACVEKKHAAAAARVRLERFAEGLCAQVLHHGPYSAEGPTVLRLHRFIAEHGYALTGKHHEIYLGDPRRTAPEKLRTIVRQPVASTAAADRSRSAPSGNRRRTVGGSS